MVSDDTGEDVTLLREINFFGTAKEQLTIVDHGKGVPVLENVKNKMILDPETYSKLQRSPMGMVTFIGCFISMVSHNSGVNRESSGSSS